MFLMRCVRERSFGRVCQDFSFERHRQRQPEGSRYDRCARERKSLSNFFRGAPTAPRWPHRLVRSLCRLARCRCRLPILLGASRTSTAAGSRTTMPSPRTAPEGLISLTTLRSHAEWRLRQCVIGSSHGSGSGGRRMPPAPFIGQHARRCVEDSHVRAYYYSAILSPSNLSSLSHPWLAMCQARGSPKDART